MDNENSPTAYESGVDIAVIKHQYINTNQIGRQKQLIEIVISMGWFEGEFTGKPQNDGLRLRFSLQPIQKLSKPTSH